MTTETFYIQGWHEALNEWGAGVGTAHLMVIRQRGASDASPLCGSKARVSPAAAPQGRRAPSQCPQCRKKLRRLEGT